MSIEPFLGTGSADQREEIARLRAILSAIHEAIGESPASDDDTLPEGIRLIMEGRAVLRFDVDRLTKERDGARVALGRIAAMGCKVCPKARCETEADMRETCSAWIAREALRP